MISIIMPAYNEEKYISKAIESILNQTIKEFQLIIVNDGSTDKTSEIVRTYEKKYKNIECIEPGKIGKNSAFNLAAKLVTGDWIYFMGADDVLPFNALEIWEKQTLNSSSSDLVVLSGKMKIISDNPKYSDLILPKKKKRLNYSGPLTLMSKQVLNNILPLPTNFPNEDTWWSLYFRFFVKNQIKVNEIIVYYRIHNNNAISKNLNFDDFSLKYHSRYIVRIEFIERFKNNLSHKELKQLNTEMKIEHLRYNKKTFSIIFSKGLNAKDKIRTVFFSSKFLYSIKIKLDRYFLGH
ncbi:MAG: glycosyltransferase family 2 protein [Firmicutes bacterium]|nr:glycosyltransferase family 2 protein [Bacillota bacterium]